VTVMLSDKHVRHVGERVTELLAAATGSMKLAQEHAADPSQRLAHVESAAVAISAACDRLRRLEVQMQVLRARCP